MKEYAGRFPSLYGFGLNYKIVCFPKQRYAILSFQSFSTFPNSYRHNTPLLLLFLIKCDYSVWPILWVAKMKCHTVTLETAWMYLLNVPKYLTGKDADVGKEWGQEEKGTTEDEMVGRCHRCDQQEAVEDRMAWRALVHVVTESRTRLND